MMGICLESELRKFKNLEVLPIECPHCHVIAISWFSVSRSYMSYLCEYYTCYNCNYNFLLSSIAPLVDEWRKQNMEFSNELA